jgi:hypothetical protein
MQPSACGSIGHRYHRHDIGSFPDEFFQRIGSKIGRSKKNNTKGPGILHGAKKMNRI